MLDDEPLSDVEEQRGACGDGHDEVAVVGSDADLDLLQATAQGDPLTSEARGRLCSGACRSEVGGYCRCLRGDGAGVQPDSELHHAEDQQEQGGQQDRPLGRFGHPALVHGRGSFAVT